MGCEAAGEGEAGYDRPLELRKSVRWNRSNIPDISAIQGYLFPKQMRNELGDNCKEITGTVQFYK
jgi:hypothetical protein